MARAVMPGRLGTRKLNGSGSDAREVGYTETEWLRQGCLDVGVRARRARAVGGPEQHASRQRCSGAQADRRYIGGGDQAHRTSKGCCLHIWADSCCTC